MHLWHRWSRWSEPQGLTDLYFRQRRTCSGCGMVEERWV